VKLYTLTLHTLAFIGGSTVMTQLIEEKIT